MQVKNLIIKEKITIKEANYKSYLAKINKLRNKALNKYYKIAKK